MSMTADRFNECLAKLGMTQVAAAKFVGKHQRTIGRWVQGAELVPKDIAILFEVMVKLDLTPEQTIELAFPKKKRGRAA
jgi:plasmid maintenance system antidote protein VapI